MSESRTIGQLAEVVGAFCFVEHSLFTLCGQWATEPVGTGPVGAEVTVFLATAARRHASLAEAWRGRLPVRAGVDQDALITAPGTVAEVFERLRTTADPGPRLTALVEVPMARLLDAYGVVEASGNPATEAPVLAVLASARPKGLAELALGQSMVGRLVLEAGPAEETKALVVELERMFEGGMAVFPGERAS